MGKLVCIVEMDKLTGAKVTVTDEEKKFSQVLHMDGTGLTITVKGDGKTSIIEQKPGRIFMKAEEIELDAQTFTMKSKQGTWDGQNTTIKASSDLKLDSKGPLSANATADLSLQGQNANLKAVAAAKVEGMTVEVKGQTSLKTEGLSTSIKGTQLQLEGTVVSLKGTAQLGCESSGMATFKGSMTQIQGALVSIG